MSSFYVGVETVFAYPQEKHGLAGYTVRRNVDKINQVESWMKKADFEAKFLPTVPGEPGAVSDEMIDAVLAGASGRRKTKTETTESVVLAGGYDMTLEVVGESKTEDGLDPVELEAPIRTQITVLLGFVLAWARDGLRKPEGS